MDAIPFDYVVTTSSMAASTTPGLGNNAQQLILDQDTWFELISIQATCSLDTDTSQMPNFFSVAMIDNSSGRLFSGGPTGSPFGVQVPQACITPYNPEYIFRRKVFFPPNANLLFNFVNLSTGSANIATLALRGYRHYELPGNALTNDKCIPFYYLVTPTLSANGNNTQTLTLDQSSTFEHHAYCAVTTQDLIGDVMPNNYSVRIQDSSGPFFSNVRVPQRIITPYNNKYMADRPSTWGPGKNLQFDFLDLSGGTNVVTFVMQGFKFFI